MANLKQRFSERRLRDGRRAKRIEKRQTRAARKTHQRAEEAASAARQADVFIPEGGRQAQ